MILAPGVFSKKNSLAYRFSTKNHLALSMCKQGFNFLIIMIPKDDRHANFTLGPKEIATMSNFCKEDGKLPNFWLDAFVRNPNLLTLDPRTLVNFESSLDVLKVSRSRGSSLLQNLPMIFVENWQDMSPRVLEFKSICSKLKLDWIDILESIPEVLALEPSIVNERKHLLGKWFHHHELKVQSGFSLPGDCVKWL